MKITALITRPHYAAKSLAATLARDDIDSILFPTIEIQALDNQQPLLAVLEPLSRFDSVIFVSQPAVRYAVLPHLVHWKNYRGSIIAIGASTANLLQAQGLSNIIYPSIASSENLLTLPLLMQVEDKNIAIFSGTGGNTLIEKTLTQRGARLEKIAVYTRHLPTMVERLSQADWDKVDVIISTSGESLSNLVTLLQPLFTEQLFNKTLLVISENMLHLAERLGFSQILVAQGASDQAISEALKQIPW